MLNSFIHLIFKLFLFLFIYFRLIIDNWMEINLTIFLTIIFNNNFKNNLTIFLTII